MIRMPGTRTRAAAGAALMLALAAATAAGQGQQPAPKPAPKPPTRGQTVEIRGQAPTPQVVTVRPREVPAYTPSGLPQAVMTSGALPSVTAAFAVTPTSQVAGRLPIDTSVAGLARGGSTPGGAAVAGAAMIGGAAAVAAGGAAAGGATVVGASAADIEAMRRDLALRKARLDSLERVLHENAAKQAALGAPPGGGGAGRMSAADSAARAAEIEAIRKELNYRKARLDSLQKVVNDLGRPPKAPAKSDSTPGTHGGTPPRGPR